MIPFRPASTRPSKSERTEADATETGISLTDEALFANDTFYLAFAEKDVAAMSRLWAKHHPTICIHPGWPAIHSREKIVRSWERILTNPDQPGIDFYNPVAHEAGNVVLVTCYEELPGGVCIATNGFVVEEGELRLFHHQATPCANPPPPKGAGESRSSK